MTYNEFTIQRLREVAGDPIFCAVSDTSEEEAITSTDIVKIYQYDSQANDFYDTQGSWWKYAVPVIVSPIPLPQSN